MQEISRERTVMRLGEIGTDDTGTKEETDEKG